MNTLHDLVADKLERADPAAREALLQIPLDNIARWLANGHTAPHRLEQWRQIILHARQSPDGLAELLRLLRDPSEPAVQLKSFDPFPGVLTTLERRGFLLRMRLRSLNQLLDAIRALAHPDRVVIIGSSSLLPQHPDLGEPGRPLEASYDSDLLITPIDEEMAAVLGEAVGQQSLFAKRYGYYADILRPSIAETLPAGWESRLHPVPGYDAVFALDPYDLAVVKLMVGREKDLELLRAMLRLGIVEPIRLRRHYQQTPLGEREAVTAGRNLNQVLGAERHR